MIIFLNFFLKIRFKFLLLFFVSYRYIELFPSTYDEAKRRIMNDARSNARQFVGEDHEDNAKINNTNNNNNGDTNNNSIIAKRNSLSRSQSRHRSRSTSRGNCLYKTSIHSIIFF